MGKRGPKPRPPGESAVVMTARIRPDLHAKLKASAAENGRSMGREIEHRLRRTFTDDEKIEEVFGSRQNYLVMKAAALGVQRAYNPGNPEATWLDDPMVFDRAVEIMNAVLQAIRPQGDYPKPDEITWGEGDAEFAAEQTWGLIQSADPNLPIGNTYREQRSRSIMKTELDDIAQRPQTYATRRKKKGKPTDV